MPGSQSLIGGGDVAGLTLHAWAKVNGTTVLAGSGVSSVTKASTGDFSLNLSTPMPDSMAVCVLRGARFNASHLASESLNASSTTTIRMLFYNNGTNYDPAVFHIAVYR